MDNYFQQSLTLIETSELITGDDLRKLTDIRGDLLRNFQVGQIFRSRWEMENSVLNDIKFPTTDAKYWQSVREQMVHFSELAILGYEYQMNAARIELLQATLDEQEDELNKTESLSKSRKIEAKMKMSRIKIDRLRYMMINQQRTAKDRIREILSWQEIMERLKPNMKHGIENYENHQAGSYALRFQKEMQIARQQVGPEMRNLSALYEMSQK